MKGSISLKPLIQSRGFITVVAHWQRAPKYTFGRYKTTLEPGIHFYLPFVHRIKKINMYDLFSDLEKQSLISKDNVTYHIDASVQYRVVCAEKTVNNVYNVDEALKSKCQMALRKVMAEREINEILHDVNDVSEAVRRYVSADVERWGILVSSIQIRDISFDEGMRRAMAVKAEADRNAEAKIINARSDAETAKIYSETAKLYSENPVTLRLREFELWRGVSKNPGTTIYVVPSNLLDKLDIKPRE